MPIKFDSYEFLEPEPIVAFGVEPVIVGTNHEYERHRIDVIGFITGANFQSLIQDKNQMINSLVKPFGQLEVDDLIFPLAELESLEFEDSEMTTILPYSASFVAYPDSGSEFYGIEECSDEWNYTEQDDQIVSATHSVSAKAIKVNGVAPFAKAKAFVESRLNGFANISKSFESSNSNVGHLKSVSEVIDEKNGSYEKTFEYLFGLNSDDSNSIIRYTINISSNNSSGLTANISGSIEGGIESASVSENDFTQTDAKNALESYINQSIFSSESDLQVLNTEVTSFSYEIQNNTNIINFQFNFDKLSNEDGPIVHEYTVSYEENSDSSIKSASINGTVKYTGSTLPYDAESHPNPRSSPRFLAVKNFYEGIDKFDLLDEHSPFEISNILRSSSESLNPFSFEISYSATYQNNNLGQCEANIGIGSISYQDDKPVPETVFINGVENVIPVTTVVRNLGQKTITVQSSDKTKTFEDIRQCANAILGENFCQKISESTSESPDQKSITITVKY